MGDREVANIFIGVKYSFDEIARGYGFKFADGLQGAVETEEAKRVVRRLITEILERFVEKVSLHHHVSYRNPWAVEGMGLEHKGPLKIEVDVCLTDADFVGGDGDRDRVELDRQKFKENLQASIARDFDDRLTAHGRAQPSEWTAVRAGGRWEFASQARS